MNRPGHAARYVGQRVSRTEDRRLLTGSGTFTDDIVLPGMEAGLECLFRYRPPMFVWSNAAHACIVEVDSQTGDVTILRWVASEDCGVMINPAVVEGRVAGSVIQGIGGVLYEHARYDELGKPTATTFRDYLVPIASDVPRLGFAHIETPLETPGGFKGGR